MFGNNAAKLISSFVNEGFDVDSPTSENITNDLDVIVLSKASINELYFVFLINASEKREFLKHNEEFFSDYTTEDGFKHLYLINLYITKEGNNFKDISLEEKESSDNKKIHVFNLEADFNSKQITNIDDNLPIKKIINSAINNSFLENKAFKYEKDYTVNEILNRSENFVLTKEKYENPSLTYGLMIINVAMFALMKFYELQLPKDAFAQGDALIKFGAVYSPFVIVYGEYWRLVTAMFVHIDIEHIILNVFSLYIFGRTLEKSMGRIPYLIIYFASGILANFFSLFSVDSLDTISAGASGGIYAIIGGILALTLVSKRKVDGFSFSTMAVYLGIGAVIEIYRPQNSSIVHTLGVVFGFIISYVIVKFIMPRKVRKNIEAMDNYSELQAKE